MIKLPTWVFPQTKPAFNDLESTTSLEAVHKLYGSVNELIEEYNKFNETLNNAWNEFKSNSEQDYDVFKITIQQAFQDFTSVVNLRLQQIEQNSSPFIEQAVEEKFQEKASEWLQPFVQLVFDSVVEVKMQYEPLEKRVAALESGE